MVLENLSNKELETRLKNLIESSRKIEADILLTLVEIRKRNIDNALGYVSLYDYCQDRFGLTKAQAMKRTQAARTIEFIPETLSMLEEGKTHVSHLALLSPKITQANKKKILDFLPGASKRNLEVFLQKIDFAGNEIDIEPKIEIKLRCSQEMLEKLERLQGLLAQSPGKTDKENVVERAFDALLDKIDPIKKDERREKRQLRKKVTDMPKVDTKQNNPGVNVVKRYIPEAVKAAVRKRDKYQCVFKGEEGRRCQEKSVLQIDHVKLWSLNGSHDVDNLRVFCPAHNRFQAEKILGKKVYSRTEKSEMKARQKIGEASI